MKTANEGLGVMVGEYEETVKIYLDALRTQSAEEAEVTLMEWLEYVREYQYRWKALEALVALNSVACEVLTYAGGIDNDEHDPKRIRWAADVLLDAVADLMGRCD